MNKLLKYLSYAFVFVLLVITGYVITLSPDTENMIIRHTYTDYSEETLEVQLSGEVKNKGKYSVGSGMTLYDVLSMAGGITESADVSAVEFDKVISQDCDIVIPAKDKDSIVAGADYEFDSGALYQKCNINTASTQQLTEIKGIGETLARRIVEYRNQNGNFNSIQEIKNVKGIGEKTYLKFKDYITVGGE